MLSSIHWEPSSSVFSFMIRDTSKFAIPLAVTLPMKLYSIGLLMLTKYLISDTVCAEIAKHGWDAKAKTSPFEPVQYNGCHSTWGPKKRDIVFDGSVLMSWWGTSILLLKSEESLSGWFSPILIASLRISVVPLPLSSFLNRILHRTICNLHT